MAGTLAERQEFTTQRLTELRQHLGEAEIIAAGKACVYATGSFGRREGCKHSDLDLFILGLSRREEDDMGGTTLTSDARRIGTRDTASPLRAFPRLDEICLEARLIEASRAVGFPEFSGDGEYLTHYPIHEFIKNLGRREDDSTNTFTARLLLLLESTPLVEADVYDEVVRLVLKPYWRNYKDNEDSFIPGYLLNDVLRLWRTFCVNYEATTREDPEDKRAKRLLKNYKLRHSRLLTCYSGLAYLLGIHQQRGTVNIEDAEKMVHTAPTERIRWLATQFPRASAQVESVLESYDAFLQRTAVEEEDLIARILREGHRKVLEKPHSLGDGVFDLLHTIGSGSLLYRMIVV